MKIIPIAALCAGLTFAGAALGAPVTLLCSMDPIPSERETEPTTLELDESLHTVTVHFGARVDTRGPGRSVSGSEDAYTVGPTPGEFTEQAIKFTPAESQNPLKNYYILNRLTGKLNMYTTQGTLWSYSWSCHVASKMF